MDGSSRLSARERTRLLEQLHTRYGQSQSRWQRLTYQRKRWSWILVIGGAKLLKRSVDIVGSLLFLVLFSPLMLGVAALIKATDRGPVLYSSQRVGKWGKEFIFPKFRSMRVDADKHWEALKKSMDLDDSARFKMKQDPRVTWIGRIIRKFSIDELPQLWCVLKGEMTLVGPRPPLPKEVGQYSLQERRRLDITPGLTGLWQVSGRSDLPFDKQVMLDVEYIQSQSIWLDFKILLKTVPAVIFGRGAY